MPEIARRLTTIFAGDVAGYSRLAAADEEGTVSRLRALRRDLIDPVIATHGGRTVKLMGDGRLIEFASVVDAVRCALDVQRGMTARNANVAPERRIEFRIGIYLVDVIVESDGDLMADGVNIAARLEGIAEPGGVCLSEDAYRQVRDKIALEFTDLGDKELKNVARPVRVYAIRVGGTSKTPTHPGPPPSPIWAAIPGQEYFVDGVTESLATDLSRISGSFVIGRHTAFSYKGKAIDLKRRQAPSCAPQASGASRRGRVPPFAGNMRSRASHRAGSTRGGTPRRTPSRAPAASGGS